MIKVVGKEIVEMTNKSEAARLGHTGYTPQLIAHDGKRYELRCFTKASAAFNECPVESAKLQDKCVYQAWEVSKRGKLSKAHTLVVNGNFGYIIKGMRTANELAHGQAYVAWNNNVPTINRADGAMYI